MKSVEIKCVETKDKYRIYEDSSVYNATKGYFVKHCNDPRRPMEPPIVYLNAVSKNRTFHYLDELMVKCFGLYRDGCFIYHFDNDPSNCKLDNLEVMSGPELLERVHHDKSLWRKVEIPDEELLYDYYISDDGRLFNATTNSFLQPFEDKRKGNYNLKRYRFYRKNPKGSKTFNFTASRLVLMHFRPNHPEEKSNVIFKDRDHNNLRVDNLMWADKWDTLNQGLEIYNKDEYRKLKPLSNSILGKEVWLELDLSPIGLKTSYKYLVSNFGRVYNETKGFYPAVCYEDPNLNNQSHMSTAIKIDGIGYKTIGIHRLVAMVFCPNDDRATKTEVNHINGNPECNWAINLEWCTPAQNLEHAIATNLRYTDKFKGHRTDEYWRLNTIVAWIFSFNPKSYEDAYDFYKEYQNTHTDDLPNLSLQEFIDTYEMDLLHNQDFYKLKNFYKENYGLGQ